MAETRDEVIIDHPRGLHQGVTDRRSDKLESPLAQVVAHRHRLWRLRRHLPVRAPRILLWPAADETPDVGIKTAELGLQREKGRGVFDRRGDLEPVANNPLIGDQRLDLRL